MHWAAYRGQADIVTYLDKAHPDLFKVKETLVRRPPHSEAALIIIALVTHRRIVHYLKAHTQPLYTNP